MKIKFNELVDILKENLSINYDHYQPVKIALLIYLLIILIFTWKGGLE